MNIFLIKRYKRCSNTLIKKMDDVFLIEELYATIFLNTTYRGVLACTGACKRFYKLISSDKFWKDKIDLEYSGLSTFKPKIITYRQQYHDLEGFPTHGISLMHFSMGRAILTIKYYPGKIRHHDTGKMFEITSLLDDIFKIGRLDIIYLIIKIIGSIDILITYHLNIASYYGHLHILENINKEYNLLPDENAYMSVDGEGDPLRDGSTMLKFLIKMKIPIPNFFGYVSLADPAYPYRGVDSPTNIYFGQYVAKTKNPKTIIPLLEINGFKIYSMLPYFAATENNIELLEYLFERNIIIDYDHIFEMACGSGYTKILLWAKEKGIIPSSEACVIEAILCMQLDIIKMLVSFGFKPSIAWLDHGTSHDIIEYIESLLC
jgi:hypothetical protein